MIDENSGVVTGPETPVSNSAPTNVTLADNSGIVFAFLQAVRGDGVVENDEYNKAKDLLSLVSERYPEVVRSCQGKTLEQAREILAPYINDGVA